VAASIVAGAVLDLAGIATLIPLLLVIAKPGVVATSSTMRRLYEMSGFSDVGAFTLVLGCAAVVALVVKNALTMFMADYQTRYLTSLYRYFSDRLFASFYGRGLLYIKQKQSADLTYNVTSQCYTYVWGLLMPAVSMLGGGVIIAVMLIIFFAVSAKAAGLLIVCIAPVVWLYVALVRRKVTEYGREDFAARRGQMRQVLQAFRAYPEIEIAGAYPSIHDRLAANLEKVSHYRVRIERMLRLPAGMMEAGIALCIALLLAARPGNMLATLTIFGVASLRMLPAIRSLMGGWNAIRQNSHTMELVAELEQNRAQEAVAPREVAFNRGIELRGVGFAYEDGGRRVIDDLSLTIARGERLAIKGPSGAGKSTLLNILLGFYPPDEGRVLIDGVELDPSTRASWQRMVGYVPQEVYLVEGTLAENVALGVEPAMIDKQKVLRVLRQVSLEAKVASLADGADTPLGENGCRLSGGERQRVGIARALYKGAGVLVFDEATSALDKQTESEIAASLTALAGQMEGLTIIAVSHRDLPFCTRVVTL